MAFYSGVIIFLAYASTLVPGRVQIPLCGNEINISSRGFEDSPILMYNMHDNENTAAISGRVMAMKYGGQYMELEHSGDRNIAFWYGEDSISIDPNRIYTDAGIRKQMEKNKMDDTILFQEIAMWRDSLLSVLKIDERSLVIALHNNTNKYYSLSSYTSGGEYELEADTTYEGKIRDMDDFYFVTDRTLFEVLCKGRYHVILQNNDLMTDDGSLSVYCAQKGIRYINVEAQHGHLLRQIKMLIFIFQHLVVNRI